jgi:hypothetical protein
VCPFQWSIALSPTERSRRQEAERRAATAEAAVAQEKAYRSQWLASQALEAADREYERRVKATSGDDTSTTTPEPVGCEHAHPATQGHTRKPSVAGSLSLYTGLLRRCPTVASVCVSAASELHCRRTQS